jgi:predicted transporter
MLEVLGQFSMIFTGVLKLFLIIFVFCLIAFFIIPAVIRNPQARSEMIFRNLKALGYIVCGMIVAAGFLMLVNQEKKRITEESSLAATEWETEESTVSQE